MCVRAGVKHKSVDKEPMLDYVAFVKNFAGANFSVDSYIRRKWENMLTVCVQFSSSHRGSSTSQSMHPCWVSLCLPRLDQPSRTSCLMRDRVVCVCVLTERARRYSRAWTAQTQGKWLEGSSKRGWRGRNW